jgi:hypothetical protein
LIFDFPKTKEKLFMILIHESQNTVIQQTLVFVIRRINEGYSLFELRSNHEKPYSTEH